MSRERRKNFLDKHFTDVAFGFSFYQEVSWVEPFVKSDAAIYQLQLAS